MAMEAMGFQDWPDIGFVEKLLGIWHRLRYPVRAPPKAERHAKRKRKTKCPNHDPLPLPTRTGSIALSNVGAKGRRNEINAVHGKNLHALGREGKAGEEPKVVDSSNSHCTIPFTVE